MPAANRSGVAGVIFDWGGTLSEYVPVDLADMWRAASAHLARDRADELCARLTAVELAAWDDSREHLRSFRLADLLARASQDLGLDVAEAVLAEAATHHLDAWTPHIRHDPDCRATLTALRDRGLRIALLSNTHWPASFHEHFLDRDGLTELIDTRLYTSDMRYRKPHPNTFLDAMHALDLDDPGRMVVVGDRPFDDIHGAQRAGMRAVYRQIPDMPAYDLTPDAVIHRLPELLPILDSWSIARPA